MRSKAITQIYDYFASSSPREPATLPGFLRRFSDTDLRQAGSDAVGLARRAASTGQFDQAAVWSWVAWWAAEVREFRQHGLEDILDRLEGRFPCSRG